MLHHVNPPDCDAQFTSIKRLQRDMLNFACDPATPHPLTEASVVTRFGAAGTWLWERLWNKGNKPTALYGLVAELVAYAKCHPELQKAALDSFDHDVSFHEHIDDPAFRFDYPARVTEDARKLIRPLMEAFYETLLANGFPHCVHERTENFDRAAFVKAFWDANPNVYVCPACDGKKPDAIAEKVYADTDHFLPKSIYPFLAVHEANLLPICVECNRVFKGDADPGAAKADVDPLDEAENAPLLNTFLPYRRPALRELEVRVHRVGRNVPQCELNDINGAPSRRVENLKRVLRLEARWNSRLKATVSAVKDSALAELRRQSRRGGKLTHNDAHETAEIMLELREEKLAQQPDYVLHRSYLRYVLDNEEELVELFELF